MRWYIIRTLLHKEVLRHWANRGGILLVVLLIMASLLLSFFGNGEGTGPSLVGGVKRCYVDYWEKDAWVRHLEENVPPELADRIRFRHVSEARKAADGTILYPTSISGIQLRNERGRERPLVWYWHSGAESGLAPFKVWLWKETQRYSHLRLEAALHASQTEAFRSLTRTSDIEEKTSTLKGGLDPRSGIATSLVVFGLFFVCVYLMPSLTCEERERGVLLAQALSPASPKEILAAKFLFYPVVALVLAAVLAGTYQPAVLVKPFFWLALVASVAGSMGIGLTIASIARTQRAASMGAMCYMMCVALVVFICQQNNIPGLPYLALEYHLPRMMHAVLGDSLQWYHWGNLMAAVFLACVWAVAATMLFRRRGWQT